MRESLFGRSPVVADSAFVSTLSYLVGDVAVGERASVWPFTCLRGDDGSVTVGDETNVQEFSMLHGAALGEGVTVGHGVVVDYATVESHSLVGMNSCVLRDATVESGCIVAAGAVVLQGQTVPEGHLAYGAPAQTKPLTDDQRDEITRVHEHYVDLSREYKETGRFE
jgi:carbonic anhydrase/acetyltransferase-like protein (isoleucine patch superfamily)